MALDEPKDDDLTIETDSLTFVIAPDVQTIIDQNGGLIVDFVDDGMRKGYMIKLASQDGADCGSCGDHGDGCG
jgi:Fe-S cluster assembly iron-binding protein IscA